VQLFRVRVIADPWYHGRRSYHPYRLYHDQRAYGAWNFLVLERVHLRA